jgi:hypothetical protein
VVVGGSLLCFCTGRRVLLGEVAVKIRSEDLDLLGTPCACSARRGLGLNDSIVPCVLLGKDKGRGRG